MFRTTFLIAASVFLANAAFAQDKITVSPGEKKYLDGGVHFTGNGCETIPRSYKVQRGASLGDIKYSTSGREIAAFQNPPKACLGQTVKMGTLLYQAGSQTGRDTVSVTTELPDGSTQKLSFRIEIK